MRRGTIVLTPFPFTYLSGQKVRPALVVSRSSRPGTDVVLAFITSSRGQPLLGTDLFIQDTHPEFAQTGLKASPIAKLDKLVTVDTAIVLGELGELSASLLQQADDKLRYAPEL